MNEQLFDAMLRTALEEALEEDCREAPAEQKHTGHTSLRQRRRMRRMLAMDMEIMTTTMESIIRLMSRDMM